ncbi:hypothetical protein BDB00DRAFT_486686 [Zychaea mexicana]|uniref:uncharacterized protein n=1 Tax=Zychaea mexicana TaxID=64656 RepID=UPI0022FE2B08|nr:uncharacterized protein BDB00DRAFT_486686 [Zychaea mexicana]KAI9491523.1 hypothetical protein BDB00DRAFT_486686 [Zychaea mexicana]
MKKTISFDDGRRRKKGYQKVAQQQKKKRSAATVIASCRARTIVCLLFLRNAFGTKKEAKEILASDNKHRIRGSLHALDGFSSTISRKNLESCSRTELLELKERNERMLRHRSVVHTLPDKGAKLKQSIRQIDVLLLSTIDDEITVDNTFPDRESALTAKLASLTFMTPRQEARRRGIALANARATSLSSWSSSSSSSSFSLGVPTHTTTTTTTTTPVTTTPATCHPHHHHHHHQPYVKQRRNSSIVMRRHNSSYPSTTVDGMNEAELQAKVCMMSLDESVRLQENRSRLIEVGSATLYR